MQSLYLSLLADGFLSQVRGRENNCVCNMQVVMLLLIIQRLQAEGCLESAVLELADLPASLWPAPCARLRPDARAMSTNTGAYNKARQRQAAASRGRVQ